MPVPMSCVPQATRAVPSSRSSTLASAGKRAAIHAQPAMPQPSVRPSRFIEPTSGVRFDQPNFSAPSSKHSSRWRDENGKPQPLVDLRLVHERAAAPDRSRAGRPARSSPTRSRRARARRRARACRRGAPTLRCARPKVTRRLGTLYRNGVASPQSSWWSSSIDRV